MRNARKNLFRRSAKVQNYVVNVPGVTQAQANATAQNLLKTISMQEKKLIAELAGDCILTPRSVLQLIGTGPRWDQIYYPYMIQRKLSFEEGFSMSVEAKNHNPNTEVDIT